MHRSEGPGGGRWRLALDGRVLAEAVYRRAGLDGYLHSPVEGLFG